jgi:hypothetical protein
MSLRLQSATANQRLSRTVVVRQIEIAVERDGMGNNEIVGLVA